MAARTLSRLLSRSRSCSSSLLRSLGVQFNSNPTFSFTVSVDVYFQSID